MDIKSPEQLLSDAVQAIQAAATIPVDFEEGSQPLALQEALIGLIMYLQQLLVEVEALTRLKTSKGENKITFGDDFNFTPPPASPASGNCTFSRTSSGQQVVILLGSIVQTADGLNRYSVVADPDNPDYDPDLGGYVMGIGIFDVDALVQCTEQGTVGNVLANTITVIASPINGVSSVTNPLAFDNGTAVPEGEEYDEDFRDYLASLESGTVTAIKSAIRQLQSNIDVEVIENEDHDGNPDDGHLTIIVDDGSGTPSGTLLTNAFNAADRVRGGGISISVFAPDLINVTIEAEIMLNSGFDGDTVIEEVKSAIEKYMEDIIKIGVTLYYAQIIKVILEVEGVSNTLNVQINGATLDIEADLMERVFLDAPPDITLAV